MRGSASERSRAGPVRARARARGRWAAAAAAALALGCGDSGGCGASVASPETQIRDALARAERARLSDVYGSGAGAADLHPVRFLDVAVAADGSRATVAAMLDAAGRVAWNGQETELRYLGREKFGMHACRGAGWCAGEDQFQRLRGVLIALFRRHDAFAARSPGALAPVVSPSYSDRGEDRDALLARLTREWAAAGAPKVSVQAWQVRVERDSAEVGEDARVGSEAPRAVRAVYRLAWERDRWTFVSGL